MAEQTVSSPRRWLNQMQAGEYVGVTERTIRNYIRSGTLRAHRLPGSRLVRLDRLELDAALDRALIPTAGGEE
ncbi:MAG: helix-turn-helix domain-containing protein [Nocardioides sp.]